MKHAINSTNTKQMLVNALITLSTQKPFSKITVSEIVSFCNINRKTFYYHFKDIYDLLEWHINKEIEHAIANFHPFNDIQATVAYSVNYINERSYWKHIIQDPIARDKITQLLYKAIYPKAKDGIEEFERAKKQNLDSDFKEFLSKNLTHIIIHSTFDTIEHPNEYDIEKIQDYITTIFQFSINGH